MSEVLKLTLTVEALERLIGGSDEIAIEVRQKIANEFAKRYLKGAVTTEVETAVKQAQAEIRAVANQAAKAALGTVVFSIGPSQYLPDKLKHDIEAAVHKATFDNIHKIMTEKLNALNLDTLVEKRFCDTLNREIDARVADKLRELLRAAAQLVQTEGQP